MNGTTMLYWLTRLDDVKGVFLGFAITLLVIAGIIIIGSIISADFDDFKSKDEIEERKLARKRVRGYNRFIVPSGILLMVIYTFLPTKNEAIFIIAGGKTIDWIKADTSISKIPSQTTLIISEFLDNQIKKLQSKETK